MGWETQGTRDGWTQSLMRTCLNETSFCLCLQEESCKEEVIQQLTGKYEFGTKQQEIYRFYIIHYNKKKNLYSARAHYMVKSNSKDIYNATINCVCVCMYTFVIIFSIFII